MRARLHLFLLVSVAPLALSACGERGYGTRLMNSISDDRPEQVVDGPRRTPELNKKVAGVDITQQAVPAVPVQQAPLQKQTAAQKEMNAYDRYDAEGNEIPDEAEENPFEGLFKTSSKRKPLPGTPRVETQTANVAPIAPAPIAARAAAPMPKAPMTDVEAAQAPDQDPALVRWFKRNTQQQPATQQVTAGEYPALERVPATPERLREVQEGKQDAMEQMAGERVNAEHQKQALLEEQSDLNAATATPAATKAEAAAERVMPLVPSMVPFARGPMLDEVTEARAAQPAAASAAPAAQGAPAPKPTSEPVLLGRKTAPSGKSKSPLVD